jgi:ribosomal-protein-alanine N-acetyltransferase
MRRSDVATVYAIERASYPFPWTRGILADCLKVGYDCRVLTVDSMIAAYAIVTRAIDEAHLLNLCVSSDYRRQGLARLLLEQIKNEARAIGANRLFLEVRPSNRSALRLYRSSDFRLIGRRPGYYPAEGAREDALVMVCHLDDDTGAAAR